VLEEVLFEGCVFVDVVEGMLIFRGEFGLLFGDVVVLESGGAGEVGVVGC